MKDLPEQEMFSPSECISLQLMQRYMRSEVTTAERKKVEAHLVDCSLCSDAMEGLMLVDSQTAEEAVRSIHHDVDVISGVKRRRNLSPWLPRIAAAAILLIMIGTTWFVTGLLDKNKVLEDAFSKNFEPIPSKTAEEQNEVLPYDSLISEEYATEDKVDKTGGMDYVTEDIREEYTLPKGGAVSHIELQQIVSPDVDFQDEEMYVISEDIDEEEEEVIAEAETGNIAMSKDVSGYVEQDDELRKPEETYIETATEEKEGKNPAILSGKLYDSGTGEALTGAAITIDGKRLGTVSDFDGYYELPLDTSGQVEVRYNYLGYEERVVPIDITRGESLEIITELKPAELAFESVIIEDKVSSQTKSRRAKNKTGDTKAVADVATQESDLSGDAIDIDPFLNEAREAYQKQDFQRTISNYNQVLEADQSNHEAIFYNAVSYLSLNETDMAIQNLEFLLTQNVAEYEEEAEWYLALAFIQAKKERKARSQLEVVIERNSLFRANAEQTLEDLDK